MRWADGEFVDEWLDPLLAESKITDRINFSFRIGVPQAISTSVVFCDQFSTAKFKNTKKSL